MSKGDVLGRVRFKSPFGGRPDLPPMRGNLTLGPGDHELDMSAPAAGTHEAPAPLVKGRPGAVALNHFAGVGFDLAPAICAPYNQPNPGRRRGA
jgi:hypothetical protein